MAILIEEERHPTNWIGIIFSVLIVALLFTGGYYLFFKRPELIEVVVPPKLQALKELSRAQFDPKSVLDSPIFKSLRDYSFKLTPPTPGRDNPFKQF